jgi:hypothetical protein
MKRLFVVGAFALAACSGDILSPLAPGVDDTGILVGAGDIGVCGSSGALATGRLLDNERGTIFVAGDIAYSDGTADQFQQCYDPAWGRHKARTRPAPGNHEYGSPGAAPYFAYFGSNAGPSGRGYYSYRNSEWKVFSLNSNTEGGERSMQIDWLRRELIPQDAVCTVAYFHHPHASSGPHGVLPTMAVVRDFWRELYAAGADVVISAHEHLYERFTPQTPDAVANPRYGLRQFIVGTGGAPLSPVVQRAPNSEVVISAFGVLRLTLELQSYRWEFVSAETGAVLDAGIGQCHGPPV